ncbi:MAG: hypothetical protein U0232_08415 [Thermomicrobiales bacterium]
MNRRSSGTATGARPAPAARRVEHPLEAVGRRRGELASPCAADPDPAQGPGWAARSAGVGLPQPPRAQICTNRGRSLAAALDEALSRACAATVVSSGCTVRPAMTLTIGGTLR